MTPVPNATDRLVIGGGATAMAFVDALLSEQPQATSMPGLLAQLQPAAAPA